MTVVEKPAGQPQRACLHAFASDIAESFDLKCVIRDISYNGCTIVSSRVSDLPQVIHLTPQGFRKPLRGKIVARDGRIAAVRFVGESDPVVQMAVQEMLESAAEEYDDFDDCEEVLLLTNLQEPLDYNSRLERYRSLRSNKNTA
ncbi:MAG: hypothetical protein VX871_03895 [Pseudomonadota bacterium]|nr:hypothetical protein [Pseudomonadota bacterium]